MKGKRKATASLNPGLIDAVEVPVVEGSVDEVKRRDGVVDFGNGENQEEQLEGEEGEKEEEEEEEEEAGEEEDGEGEEVEVEGGGGEEEEEERPKLDEGFFEIEAIRRKRIRKGQLQYFIKWRGWPETANTWEPLENLLSCSDVIDAFEESLRTGKSSRKRKRKYGVPHTQPKKRPRSSANYDLTEIEVGVVDEPSSLINNSGGLANLPAPSHFMGLGHEKENDGNVENLGTAKQADENGSINGSKQGFDRKEDNEYDPKLSELRGTVSINDHDANNLAIHFQEGMPLNGNGPASGLPNVGYMEPVQNNRRTGAKRRKSGSVKRFRKELAACEPLLSQNSSSHVTVGAGATTVHLGTENPSLTGSNSTYRPLSEDLRNESAVTKILKPIGFSASVVENMQDVRVTFAAMRSDGKEVVVDNQFLKANNPLLLINFYEQHLKYNT